MDIEFILYVADQQRSRDFYATLLAMAPSLDVPGMTEFSLRAGVKLGLMPEKSISKLLGSSLPHPSAGNGIPRCELYLKVSDIQAWEKRALNLEAPCISAGQDRDWGDFVSYWVDPDGHVFALATSSSLRSQA